MSTDEHEGRSAEHADCESRWVATTGRDAVNATERLICGTGAVPTAARAEGFALAGGPAATLIDPRDTGWACVAPFAVDTAWVYHRIGVGGPGARRGFAAELIASTAQEAVDHCLVAHRLARALGRPCLCTLDASIADEPNFVELPDVNQIRAALDAKPVAFRSPREEARLAFEDISVQTGRECRPLHAESADDAEYLLVALGASRGPALRMAAELRARGVRCGTIGVVLAEPFPLDDLSSVLSGKRGIAVVHAGSDIAATELLAWVRSTAASTPGIAVSSARVSGNQASEFTETLIALGLEQDATSNIPPVDEAVAAPRRSVVLGAAPASAWAESFLRDVAALLRNLGPVTLERPATSVADTAVLAICGPEAGPLQTDALDVLLAPDLATLCKSPGLAALRPGGVALLTSDPNHDPISPEVLTSTDRAALLLRETRLFRLRRPVDASPGPTRRAPHDSLLLGALLGVAPELGALVDRAEVHACLEQGEAPDALEAAWIRRGQAALEKLDAARMETELEDSTNKRDATPVPAQEVAAVVSDDAGAAAWSEALWHFHLTGEGAHSLAEPPPGLPLLPLVSEMLNADRTAYPLDLDSIRESTVAPGTNEPRASVDLEPGTPLRLYTEASRAARSSLRRAFTERACRLAWRMGELLGYPDAQGPAAPSAAKLAGSLGEVSDAFFDADALSHMLPRAAAAQMSAAGHERVERVWRTLKAFVERDAPATDMIVVHPPETPSGNGEPGLRAVAHEDGLRAAIGIFDSLALTEAVRAVRIAELEIRRAYDETIHDRLFARFDWQSFSVDELLLLPQVVVLVSGARLRGPSLAALSELLRSGRPVHVLVSEHLAELHGSDDASMVGYPAGLGYLTLAHREAFVLQSSLGTPQHLVEGLRRMVTSLCPAVALIATPDWQATVPPMVQLAAAHAGRATPTFLFDPAAGETLAERFDLTGNPQIETTWPLSSLRYLDGEGREQTRQEALTFAHAVALLAGYRRHFRVLPPAARSDEQTEIAEWLDLPEDRALRSLPFIRVQTGGGQIGRAVLTRELAFACRDRARTWRLFTELARTAQTITAEAAVGETTEIAKGAEARPSEDRRPQLDAANRAAVRAAMERLVQNLLDPNGKALPASTIAMVTSPAAVAPTDAVPAALGEPAPAPAPAVEGPFIDTPLCTSCNECTNLNGRLFVYDENKQARIGDVSAGTFKQLVMAAEKCPARCIHPGSPRSGDSSATKALIARAAPFQ